MYGEEDGMKPVPVKAKHSEPYIPVKAQESVTLANTNKVSIMQSSEPIQTEPNQYEED